MPYTVANVKTELEGVLHGTTVNQVQGLNVLMDRAARTLLNDIDPIETVRIANISPFLFDKVYDYTCPTDLKDDRVIDLRPQVNRKITDQFQQVYNEQFDAQKGQTGNSIFQNPSFTIQWDDSVKTLRINKSLQAPLLINAISSITDNGTWAVGGNASNLAVDSINYVYAGSSLSFDISAGGAGSTAWIQNSTMQPVDLTELLNQGNLFVYAYIPDPSIITNYIIRYGSDASNYYTVTATTAFNSVAFQQGWNLITFPWSSATTVGSPVVTAINFVRLTVTYNGTADTDLAFNSLTGALGTIYEIEYYSKYLFRNATTGAFQENIILDSDLINLDTTSYNIYFSLVAYYCAQQIQGNNSSFDVSFFKGEYENAMARYKQKIKSQTIRPSSTYYSVPKQRYILNRS